jgi:hypothetical protein
MGIITRELGRTRQGALIFIDLLPLNGADYTIVNNHIYRKRYYVGNKHPLPVTGGRYFAVNEI